MNKILILGNSGSGKSTLGRLLSDKLNIDLYFLDKCVFKNSWKERDYDSLNIFTKDVLKKDKYILDGNFLKHSTERFEDCDTIIFLDINRFTCLKSVLNRKNMYKDKYRESRSEDLNEHIDFSYIMWVIFWFYIKYKPKIRRILKNAKDKNIIILKNRKQVNEFVDNI